MKTETLPTETFIAGLKAATKNETLEWTDIKNRSLY